MEFLIELIFGIVWEAIAELLGWVILELICRGTARLVESLLRLEAPYLLPICGLLGVGLGASSAGLFPHHIMTPSRFHGIHLIVSPIVMGLTVHLFSSSRRRKGKETYRFEAFSYGFLFALCFALTRFMILGRS